jgi:hypothetical protein
MFQAEGYLVMGEPFITAPEKLFRLFVELELRTGYFALRVCSLRGYLGWKGGNQGEVKQPDFLWIHPR